MARTGFGRWVRDRFRRALGVTDLAGRAEATEERITALAGGVDALNGKLTAVPGGVDAVGVKLTAVAAKLDALTADRERADAVAARLASLEERVAAIPSVDEAIHLRAEVARLGAEVSRLEGEKDPRTPDLLRAANEGRLVKLEYPPSYDFRARWGYSRPSHAGLTALFATQDDHYRAELREMIDRLPQLQAINRHFSHDRPGVAGWLGGPVNTIDTALLYHFVAKYKPKTYLEIGSGLSTLFASRAVKDHGLNTKLVSIDPNPRAFVDGVCDEVIRQPFEVGDLEAFAALEPGDIVFMDGSHRTFPNSDVTVFMLDVLPFLKPGVVVHVHDIVLPDDYPQMFVEWYWSEQYILAAYLIGMGDKIDYLMPSYYATRKMPGYADLIRPVLDWWGEESADMWLSGGSIWFTHRQPAPLPPLPPHGAAAVPATPVVLGEEPKAEPAPPPRPPQACRVCDSTDLEQVLDLGLQPWCNHFLKPDEVGTEPTYPLRLVFCHGCTTTQLDYTVKKEVMFGDHTYLSGVTKSLSSHFKGVADEIDSRLGDRGRAKTVLDIGSNDGTQLKHFQALGYDVLGVESSKTTAQIALDAGVPTVNDFFNLEVARKIGRKFDAINAAGVFFHLEELHSVTDAIRECLEPDGLFCVQFLYMKRIVENLAFDQIYHEHLLYYNLANIEALLNRHGLAMYDCHLSPIHGGSIIGFVGHQGAKQPTERLTQMRQAEIDAKSNDIDTYRRFAERVAEMKTTNLDYLAAKKGEGKRIFGMGAPVKGNTLLNYFGVGQQYLDCLVEKNTLRKGLYSPGMHLPVRIESELPEPPDVYYVLAWNFKTEILANNQHLIDRGVEFFFPVDPDKTTG